MTDSDDLPDRDDVLALLDDAMTESHRKVESGRVRAPENEKVRQGWVSALVRTAGEYRLMLADRDDLDDLRERVEEIEQQNRDDGGGNPYRYK